MLKSIVTDHDDIGQRRNSEAMVAEPEDAARCLPLAVVCLAKATNFYRRRPGEPHAKCSFEVSP